MTKTEITNELKAICRDRAMLFTFNSYRSMPRGARYHPDHTIISTTDIIYIEVKIGNDTLSDGQIEAGEILSECADNNSCVHYFVLTDKNAREIYIDITRILQ